MKFLKFHYGATLWYCLLRNSVFFSLFNLVHALLQTSLVWLGYPDHYIGKKHRRRINTEEKAKVVAAVWGTEFIQFLAAQAVLPRAILKNRKNSPFSFKSSWCNSFYSSNRHRGKQLARQGITVNKISSPRQERRLLPFLLSLSFFSIGKKLVLDH